MRKILFMLVWVCCCVPMAKACEVCGCSGGGNAVGALPQYQRHFIGLRYLQRSFQSQHTDSDTRTTELFRSTELVGRFFVTKRWQVIGILPYHQFLQQENGKILRNNGIGDVSILGSFTLLNKYQEDTTTLQVKRQTWFIGGGMKMPTGNYNTRDSDQNRLNTNLQMGSGSYDFLLNSAYTYRKGKHGFYTDFFVQLNSENQNGLQRGNSAALSVNYFQFYDFATTCTPDGRDNAFKIMPSIGIRAEAQKSDIVRSTPQSYTKGQGISGTLGFDVYKGNFALQTQFQAPIMQHFGEGQVTNQPLFSVGLTYLF